MAAQDAVAVQDQKRRVIVRAHVLQIPGDEYARHFTLGHKISQYIFQRDLRRYDSDVFDAVHCLPGFDSKEDVKSWFLYDFGVSAGVDDAVLEQIPTEMYLAHVEGSTWFVLNT